MNLISKPWEPQDLLDDLQLMIDELPDSYTNTDRWTLCTAQSYLKEFFEAQKNDPLPLSALQQMDGEPVWVHNIKVNKSFWMLAYQDCVCNRLGSLNYLDHGKTWIAYRNKPINN